MKEMRIQKNRGSFGMDALNPKPFGLHLDKIFKKEQIVRKAEER
jgi:hypothetical protein